MSKVKTKKPAMAYIKLYADEYPQYVWEEMCDIAGKSPGCHMLTIPFDKNKVKASWET